MACPEYKAIQRCFNELVKTIALNINNISDQLFSNEFITEPVSKRMRGVIGIDSEVKAGELVDNILHQIRLNKKKYYEFLEILCTEMSQDGMIERLESTRQSNL